MPGDVVIATERFDLRLIEPADAVPLQRLYGDPEAMRYVGAEGRARSPEQTARGVGRLIEHQERHGYSLWAVTERETAR